MPSVSAPAAMTAETAVGVAAPRARLALLLLFAPALVWLVGLIVLLIWFCTKGTDGPNRFGPDPLPGGGQVNPRPAV